MLIYAYYDGSMESPTKRCRQRQNPCLGDKRQRPRVSSKWEREKGHALEVSNYNQQPRRVMLFWLEISEKHHANSHGIH